MSEAFCLPALAAEASGLFAEARHALANSRKEEVSKLAPAVPTALTGDEKPLSLVFVGQYSAGKSSILRLLTGKDLKRGQGVTTASVAAFDWNGLRVVDTPGIHTQKHPDHDKITYEAIAGADLLVFVLTNEGFGDYLGRHFRKLINEMGKGREMMLVVNKMDNEANGNDPETQRIKTRDLDQVLAPHFSAREMYVTFMAADLYEEALSATDPQDRAFCLEQSGWESFITNLNRFARDKKLLGRLTTPLFHLERLLEDALASFSTDCPEVDATRELLLRNKKAFEDCRSAIRKRAGREGDTCAAEIEVLGGELAMRLEPGSAEEAFKRVCEEKVERVNALVATAGEGLAAIISEEADKLGEKLRQISQSQFAVDLRNILEGFAGAGRPGTKNWETCAKGAKMAGQMLEKLCRGPKATDQLFKLIGYSNSPIHQAVLKVGKFFGVKFRPWEAVKWTRGIGVAGAAAGALAGVAFQIMNDRAEEKAEAALNTARSDIRKNFRQVASDFEMKYDEQTNTWIAAELDPKIAEYEAEMARLDSAREMEDQEYERLSALLRRTRELIQKIQTAASCQA